MPDHPASPRRRPPDRLLLAGQVLPVVTPALTPGAVLVRAGRIVELGPANVLSRQHPHATRVNLGDVLLLPGLVNAHTHLELSGLSVEDTPAMPFERWLLTIAPRLAPDSTDFQSRLRGAIRAGLVESLAAGVTCIGDITQFPQLVHPILADGPIRSVSFVETLGLAKARGRFEKQLTGAARRDRESRFLRCGISPHAPYTVDERGFVQVVDLADRLGMPLCTHLAEHPAEREFCQTHTGPLRALWESLNAWEDHPPPGVGAVAMMERVGLLQRGATLAHCNHVDDQELGLLASRRANVVYCPRTHAYFAHPPHRFREMLAAGVNVALGTDSRASSPNLDLLEEARLVRRLACGLPSTEILAMITTRAARAVDERRGAIAPGFPADFAVFPRVGPDPLETLLREPLGCAATIIAGESVHTDALSETHRQ